MIHPSAIVDQKAILGKNVSVGPFTIIDSDVIIGDNTIIESSVVIKGKVRIGQNNHIYSNAIIGVKSQDLKDDGTTCGVQIGSENIIREFVTIHRSTNNKIPTIIGNNNLIMTYVHIAHDCIIKNNTVIANAVNMAGHVQIEDNVILGGNSGISQFVRIGTFAFIGGFSGIAKDIPPYTKGIGFPYKIKGLNSIGLRRQKISEENIDAIKEIFKSFYYSDLTFTRAKELFSSRDNLTIQQKIFLDFTKKSSKGLNK